MRTIRTVWKLRSYDVWGNAKDGYEVNDVRSAGEAEIECEVKTYNVGTPQQFDAAHPSDKQIRQACGIGRVHFTTEGDDMTIYINRKRDLYPIGEMHCVSHASLSPIRELPVAV